MFPPCVFAFLAVAFAISAQFKRWFFLRWNGLREPPGPRPLPFIGNILDIPSANEPHVEYKRMSEQYGPVMRFRLLDRDLVVVSSPKIINDLFEKRGSMYSDRPPFTMASLTGWGWALVLLRHGDEWRRRRRWVHRHFNTNTMDTHSTTITSAALTLARRLLETPEEFRALVRWFASATILRATYGKDIESTNDPLVRAAADGMKSFSPVVIPGTWAVDTFPTLRFLPQWFPGARFKRLAAQNKQHADNMLNLPFDWAIDQLECKVEIPSMVANALHSIPDEIHDKVRVVELKEAAGSMYLGGSDTTVSTILSFFLEMARHPEVQRKAQDEMQRVVGSDRLPTLDDQKSLPYLEAVIRELHRIHPVIPLGVPHALARDDVYEGMYLPRGTIVLPNIWGILRDASMYDDPDTFKPERFMRDGEIDGAVPDPKSHTFGYGRRACPGKAFAETSIFITLSIVLACFDIRKVVENGEEIIPSGTYHHGLVSAPDPFKCSIVPRSEKAAVLINQNL